MGGVTPIDGMPSDNSQAAQGHQSGQVPDYLSNQICSSEAAPVTRLYISGPYELLEDLGRVGLESNDCRVDKHIFELISGG